ncbi:nudix hydrolase 11-like [Anneissia japonica]|uniref:nudix hydrolase 11-like n=1 Tax=Anneissia japonica TaxID=1529436 RepID=UPI0014257A51|nr:nudix hydrolase 11-like [Anneissia japonica]
MLSCKELIVERLKAKDTTRLKKETKTGRKRATVLVPLFFKNDSVHVLLTVRAQHMKSFAGDVALPGGKRDECDNDDVDTALREAWEEIGLPKTAVQVISQGSSRTSEHGLQVVPVIGFIPDDFQPCLNLDEVEDSFSVPLIDFLLSNKHSLQMFGKYIFPKFTHNIGNKTYKIWGLTAHICIDVASIVFDKKPDFHYISNL